MLSLKLPVAITLALDWFVSALDARIVTKDELAVAIEVMLPKTIEAAVAKLGKAAVLKMIQAKVADAQWQVARPLFEATTTPEAITGKSLSDALILKLNKMASEFVETFNGPTAGAGVIAIVFPSGRVGCKADKYTAYATSEEAQEAQDVWYDETAQERRKAMADLQAGIDEIAGKSLKSAKVTK